MPGERSVQVDFRAHLELLRSFLAERTQIVEAIQGLLSAQGRPIPGQADRAQLSHRFEDCFFSLPAINPDQARLRGQLEAARAGSGFRPREMPGMHNDLVQPAEMLMRGVHLWRQTRWPGRNGRIRYAHTLFNLYVIRCLELLIMRLWDAGPGDASERLAEVQGVLDQLWRDPGGDQPVLMRDARWLIPLAQSPTTDDLAPYFEVAELIDKTLSDPDRLEAHKACVQTAGGHLRSQLRHYCIKKGVSLDEISLVLSSRNSNALDFALLVEGLVPLLEAYEGAVHRSDRRMRLELAGAICQGISPDPDLFVNRLDLLSAYSMIEHLFVATDPEAHVLYTPMARRHIDMLQKYAALIARLAKPLHDDCPHFAPVDGAYSPYGVIYGFTSNLTEHMALKSLQSGAVNHFTLEDVFADADASADKLDWVSGWRKLPHIEPEVQKQFEYPQAFAEAIFHRIEHALRTRVSDDATHAAAKTGRLFIAADAALGADSKTSQIPELPVGYVGSSDVDRVAAHKAHSVDETRLLQDRQEGMFVVSYRTPRGWTAISKDILTEVLGAGHDAKIVGLPVEAAQVLRLMCPDLIDP